MKKITLISLIAAVLGLLVLIHIRCRRKIHIPEDVPRRHSQTRQLTQSSMVFDGCKQNVSAANIIGFESFPAHLKKFLYYQHCRHFPLLLNTPDKCGGADWSDDVFLLLVIKTSPGNYERREVLRKTWAKEKEINGRWVRRIFISGTAGYGFEKVRLNELLEVEQQEHNDIIQWDFEDTHCNLTLKQVLLMEWLDKNCPNAHFLFNGDDDVFAHTENMVKYLQSIQDDDGGKHLFAGYTASVMYRTSQSIPLFPMDDVYLGMILAKAGLNLTHHAGVKTFGLQLPTRKLDELDLCFYKDLLLAHRFLPAQIYVMWHRVHDPDLNCYSRSNQIKIH